MLFFLMTNVAIGCYGASIYFLLKLIKDIRTSGLWKYSPKLYLLTQILINVVIFYRYLDNIVNYIWIAEFREGYAGSFSAIFWSNLIAILFLLGILSSRNHFYATVHRLYTAGKHYN